MTGNLGAEYTNATTTQFMNARTRGWATEIFDAIHDNVATKQDLQALEVKLDLVKHQLITRLGGLMVVLAGLLFAALHYWPPHG